MELDFSGLTDDEVWAAGMLSVFGSFTLVKSPAAPTAKNGPRAMAAKLTIRSTSHIEAVQKFAQIIGTEAKIIRIADADATQVVLTSKKLHQVMTLLWGALPRKRKQEYAAVRKAIKTGVVNVKVERG